MKIPKAALAASILLFSSLIVRAQVKIPVTNNDLRTNLQKVISAFPEQFSGLKGEVIIENPQTTEYTSLLDFKMAAENSITEYKAKKPLYSWQAQLLSSEDFAEAAKKYKWLYNQLKVMTVNLKGGYSFTFSGDYNEPDERKSFSSSIFKLTPNASNMPRLKIEALIRFDFPEWKVSLLVYEREREDAEQGDIIEQ